LSLTYLNINITIKNKKEELKKQPDYIDLDHLREFLNVNKRKGIIISVIKIKNKYKYIGGVKNEKKEGFGVQKWTNNAKYLGLYKNDFVEGLGKFRYYDGIMHHGRNL